MPQALSAVGWQDKVPMEEYAIQKVLRKSIQDCAQPMLPTELAAIRKAIHSPYKDERIAIPLTEAEIDESLRQGLPIHWKLIRRLPHVLVAWRMRCQVPLLLPSHPAIADEVLPSHPAIADEVLTGSRQRPGAGRARPVCGDAERQQAGLCQG